jgi:hypothetical protein
MAVSVTTSCRLDGRAQGGAADTMRLRHAVPDSPCDDDLEPALQATRRAICRGQLRKLLNQSSTQPGLPPRWRVAEDFNIDLIQQGLAFDDAWQQLSRSSPILQRGEPLRPSDLPRQIAIARLILQQLRMPVRPLKTAPADRSRLGAPLASAG